jgi:hypothetical protein
VYLDVVVQKECDSWSFHQALVIEIKGAHLGGNTDTACNCIVATFFSHAGRRVSWQQLGADFKDRIFRFQILDEAQEFGRDWSDALADILSADD